MRGAQQRLDKLEKTTPGDVVLFDCNGNVIFRWHPSRFSNGALQAYCHLLERVRAGDPLAVSIVRDTARASQNFGRLHEILASLLDVPGEVLENTQNAAIN